jgi:hypothetical protein
MNETIQTLAPEHVVPVPVPVPLEGTEAVPSAPPEPPPPLAASAASDDLPTSRLQSLPAALPPPVPPPGPALKTQPLRAISRDDATAKLAAHGKRHGWQTILAHLRRAAASVPQRLGRREAWTERRIGVACAALGLTMIAVALVLGWQSVGSERLEKLEHVPVAVAVVLSRAALAIAAMVVGYGLLRVGERTALASRGRRDEASKVD